MPAATGVVKSASLDIHKLHGVFSNDRQLKYLQKTCNQFVDIVESVIYKHIMYNFMKNKIRLPARRP